MQMLAQLAKDGYPSTLGDPFFWPDQAVQPNGQNRYAPTSTNGSNFVSQMMQDFYAWLQAN